MAKLNLVVAQLLVDSEAMEDSRIEHEMEEMEDQRMQDLHDSWDMDWLDRQHEMDLGTEHEDRDFDWSDQAYDYGYLDLDMDWS